MKYSMFVCVATTVVLLGFANACWAAGITINGTADWSSDVTLDTSDSWFAIGSRGDGTLNQTGGMVIANTSWGMAIGEIECTGTYNMSGNAGLITTGGNITNVRMGPGPSTTAIWNMTDNATAAIGLLKFSDMGTNCTGILNLSGSANFAAADISFSTEATNVNYINFTSGSLATLTVDSMVLADYETLVTNGNIRLENTVQPDFSVFQVANHTLSLATSEVPEPCTLTVLVTGLLGLLVCTWRRKK